MTIRTSRPLVALLAGAALAACGAEPALQERTADTPRLQPMLALEPEGALDTLVAAAPAIATDTGEATFYSDRFQGRRTASGARMDQEAMVAAHRRYPFGTRLRVTNLENDRSVEVRVIDRGPYGAAKKAKRKIIDLSRRAAQQLGYIGSGRALVRVEVLAYGDGRGGTR